MTSRTLEFIGSQIDPAHVLAYRRDTRSLDLIHVAHGAPGKRVSITTLSDLDGDPAGAFVATSETKITAPLIPMRRMTALAIAAQLDKAAGR
jgi:hypothetical protein